MIGDNDWLAAHGIEPEVWRERGVWRYEQGDPRVKEAFRDFLPRTRLGTVTGVVNQCGGLVLPKHAPPGFPPIPPQLRPDVAVVLDWQETWHYHGPLEGEWPAFPEGAPGAGKKLPRVLVLTGLAAENHIGKGKLAAYDPETGEGRHGGVNVEVVHRHPPEPAKYVLLGEGKRIDLHPRALKLLPSAERVFFVLEGALKNDAVLSAGECVFSVPSVTLWGPAELRALAVRLRGKIVFIVPDADWFHNRQVDQQALLVRTLLRRCGVETHIAAPPVKDLQQECLCSSARIHNGSCETCGGFLKGADDYLAAGGTIDGLSIRGREAPRIRMQRLNVWDHQGRTPGARRAMEGLSLHAEADGTHYRSLGRLARIMSVDKRGVVGALNDLRKLRAITTRGSLEVAMTEWNGVKVNEWRERPAVVVEPKYRAVEDPTHLLGDFWRRRVEELNATNVEVLGTLKKMEAQLDRIARRNGN